MLTFGTCVRFPRSLEMEPFQARVFTAITARRKDPHSRKSICSKSILETGGKVAFFASQDSIAGKKYGPLWRKRGAKKGMPV